MRSKITLALACACLLAIALIGAATLRAEPSPEPNPEPTPEPTTSTATTKRAFRPRIDLRKVQRRIHRYRRETWRWQRTMGRHLTWELRNPPRNVNAKVAAWMRVARNTRRVAQNPPHKNQWLCIHRYEGSWTDPAPPYYGGLQMDLSFQRTYGAHLLSRKGTADRWTPLEQMWVAERAHRAGLGFSPWPNTARYCGLF